MRVWAAGIDYVTGDVVAYPDKDSPQYECQTGHTSQDGWEPPNAPALWKPVDDEQPQPDAPQMEAEPEA